MTAAPTAAERLTRLEDLVSELARLAYSRVAGVGGGLAPHAARLVELLDEIAAERGKEQW